MTRPATKGRNAILHAMAEAVHKTGNTVLVDTYAQKTALRLGVSPEAVRAEFKKIPAVQTAPVADEDESFESAESTEVSRPSNHESHLLKLLLLHENLVSWAALHLDTNWISHPVARQIVEQRLAAQKERNVEEPRGVFGFVRFGGNAQPRHRSRRRRPENSESRPAACRCRAEIAESISGPANCRDDPKSQPAGIA